MIKFKCEFCDQRLGVPDDFVGKRVRCTKCRAVNEVPSAEVRAAREAAKSAAALASAPKASLPSEPPPSLQKMALHSSLLDLSSGSGLLGLPGADSLGDSKIFGTPKLVPAFEERSQPPMPVVAPVAVEAGKGGTAFGVRLVEELSFDDEEFTPASGEKPGRKIIQGDDYGLGLPDIDPTDSNPGKVDLDGLGF